ncbi:hypothetical protein BH23CYA1_BH23CYA1_15820 [soil metagenome]
MKAATRSTSTRVEIARGDVLTMMLMSADGWNTPALAKAFSCHEHTVRTTIKRWNELGLYGFWEKEGRGSKAKWQPSDLDYLIECLVIAQLPPKRYAKKEERS